MGVAQFGSALEWGSRGRGFKSLHPYQQKDNPIWVVFFVYLQSLKKGLERVGIAGIQPINAVLSATKDGHPSFATPA